MGKYRRVAAPAVVLLALIVLGLVFGRASSPRPVAGSTAHAALHERAGEGEGGADAEAYTDRAYPASEITIDEVQGAIKADAKLKPKNPKLISKWDFLGPDTLDVDRLGTQSFIKPTQWSGPRDGADGRPEVQARRSARSTSARPAAASGARRTRSRRSRTWKQISDGHPDERDRLDRRRPERPDRQDDLRRHRRGERERRQRGRARPLQDDRRRRALDARAGVVRRREPPRRSPGSRSSRATRTTS